MRPIKDMTDVEIVELLNKLGVYLRETTDYTRETLANAARVFAGDRRDHMTDIVILPDASPQDLLALVEALAQYLDEDEAEPLRVVEKAIRGMAAIGKGTDT